MRIVLRLLSVNADAIEAIVVDSLSSDRYVSRTTNVNSLTCQGRLPGKTPYFRTIPIRLYREGRIKLPLLSRRTDHHPHEKSDSPFLHET